jgi:hypothetical protein
MSTAQDILKKNTKPLAMPQSHIDEYASNGIDLVNGKDEEIKESAGCNAVGYQFDWGQLLEHECGWEIRFDSLHRAFLEVGGNGNELADCSGEELDTLREKGLVPDFLVVDDSGYGSSSVNIFFIDPGVDRDAREFMATKFLSTVMPRLIQRLKLFC